MKLTCFGTVAGGWLSDKFLGVGNSANEALRKIAGGHPTVSLRMYSSGLQSWSGGDWFLFQELLQILRKIADEKARSLGLDVVRVSIANIAAQWVLDMIHKKGSGGGVIIGIRDTNHLAETKLLLDHNGEDGDMHLTNDQLTRIERVLDKGNFPTGEDIWSKERGDGHDDL